MTRSNQKTKRDDDADVCAIENEMHSLTNLRVAVIDLGCHLGAFDGFHKAIGVQVPPSETVFIFHICRGTPFLALIASPDSKPQINEFPLSHLHTFRSKAEAIVAFISQYQESMNETYLKRLRTSFSTYKTNGEYLEEVATYLLRIYSTKSEVVPGKCDNSPRKKVEVLEIETESFISLMDDGSNLHFFEGSGHFKWSKESECLEVEWFTRGDPIDTAESVYKFIDRTNAIDRENREIVESWTFGDDGIDGKSQA